MTCGEFLARLPAYVDGELGVVETLAAETHAAACAPCGAAAARERGFRYLLRHQPRESAPAELRARVVAALGGASPRVGLRRWLAVPVAAAAAALVATLLPALRPGGPLVEALIDKHVALAQVERPAEFTSTDHGEVARWFRDRAGLRVRVPDYSPAGIRLVGARLAEVQGRRAAYVLYKKGHTLLSVFVAPRGDRPAELRGTPVTYRGHEYLTLDQRGYRTVSWSDGRTVFGLVSMLDYDALLECADRLRAEHARREGT